jgi:hypothetical protein
MTNVITNSGFWPDGIRLVISVSIQFEAGGQLPKGTDSPFPKVDFPESVSSDAAVNTWFVYGYREGSLPAPQLVQQQDDRPPRLRVVLVGGRGPRHGDRVS